MAHIVIEYSANLRGQFDLDGFLRTVHGAALATGVFPIGGIRTRAYELYAERGYANGNADDDWLRAEREVLSRHGKNAQSA